MEQVCNRSMDTGVQRLKNPPLARHMQKWNEKIQNNGKQSATGATFTTDHLQSKSRFFCISMADIPVLTCEWTFIWVNQ